MTSQVATPPAPADDGDIAIPGAVDIDAITKDFAAETPPKPPTAEERAANPKSKEEYTFTVEVVNGDGSVFKEEFTNRILDPGQHLDVGVLATRLCKNTPYVLLDPRTVYWSQLIAHLSTSLTKKPEKFIVSKTKNVQILEAIYEEVVAHERYFRGPRADQG